MQWMEYINVSILPNPVTDKQERRYDLPLHNDEGTGFVIVLVALMAFLSAMILSFSFGLGHIMHGWSESLDNKFSIELPATDLQGKSRDKSDILELQTRIIKDLSRFEGVETVESVPHSKIQNMIKSWLGETSFTESLNLPSLISIQVRGDKSALRASISKAIQDIDPLAIIDTHEQWLNDLFRVTSSLQSIILLIVLVIALTTVIAIAGAIKSQIEIHRSDVELLHLMGARDSYIANQFTRHAAILSIYGGIIGLIAGFIALFSVSLFLKTYEDGLMPHMDFHVYEALFLR